jgi:hypothetical protein
MKPSDELAPGCGTIQPVSVSFPGSPYAARISVRSGVTLSLISEDDGSWSRLGCPCCPMKRARWQRTSERARNFRLLLTSTGRVETSNPSSSMRNVES